MLRPWGGVEAPARPSPTDLGPSFSCFLLVGWGGREVREGGEAKKNDISDDAVRGREGRQHKGLETKSCFPKV